MTRLFRKYLLLSMSLLCAAPMAAATDHLMRSNFNDCDGVELPGLQFQATPTSWNSIFGQTWPNPLGNFQSVSIDNGFMVSFPFVAAGSLPIGVIETSDAPGQPAASRSISISTCRGDFRPQVLQNSGQWCLGSGSNPALVFAIGFAPSETYCPLVSGATYWLNIAYFEIPHKVPAISTCLNPPACTMRLGARSLTRAEFEAVQRLNAARRLD